MTSTLKTKRTSVARTLSQEEVDRLNAQGVRTMHVERRVEDDTDKPAPRRKRRAVPRIGTVIG
jgi:protein tyrosine phosphatase (PTP) superfamily phosphohydrolase (DUF442 family)